MIFNKITCTIVFYISFVTLNSSIVIESIFSVVLIPSPPNVIVALVKLSGICVEFLLLNVDTLWFDVPTTVVS